MWCASWCARLGRSSRRWATERVVRVVASASSRNSRNRRACREAEACVGGGGGRHRVTVPAWSESGAMPPRRATSSTALRDRGGVGAISGSWVGRMRRAPAAWVPPGSGSLRAPGVGGDINIFWWRHRAQPPPQRRGKTAPSVGGPASPDRRRDVVYCDVMRCETERRSEAHTIPDERLRSKPGGSCCHADEALRPICDAGGSCGG